MKPLLPLLFLAFACSCPAKPATTTTPPAQGPTQGSGSGTTPTTNPGSGSGSGSAAEPTPSWPAGGPGIGETCGANDACAQGLTCVSYYGIAGARGPQFKSCEIKCQDDSVCPAGHKCITIADGPGQVCRK